MPRAARIVPLSIITCVLAVATLTAQPQVKRTAWGDPDLRGVWPSGSMMETPFERPIELGTRAELTEAEFAQRSSSVTAQAESALAESGPGGGSPPHWDERGRASRQASLVVDPPDGRLPPMTDAGASRAAAWRARTADTYPVAGPEDLTPYDRCITRGVLGSAFPNIYSAGMEILQAPGYVIIRYEMIHETRIIPLDGRPHVGSGLRSYMGDARARWDGATLVIETTNFNGKTGSFGRNANGNPTTEALRLVERYTLTGANRLQYRVTVDDPKTWTRPWTVSFPLQRDTEYKIFEYACHEGNYAMRNILSGARVAEARAGQ